jgi:hypothetical protein
MTCTVTGTLRNSSGVALANTPVSFLRDGVFAQDGSVILDRMLTTVSDAFGEISIDLLPGNYVGIATDHKGSQDGFPVAVPDAASADLADIINDQVEITPTILAQAIAARDVAQAAAQAASDDADAAAASEAAAAAIVGSGNGRFPDGSAATPALSFASDPDTGFFRAGVNTIGAATGGVVRWLLSTTGLVINVPISGTAVTQSQTDATAGRLLKVGDFGIGIGATSGGVGANSLTTNIDTIPTPSGDYRAIGELTPGTYPPARNTFGTLSIRSYDSANQYQLYMPIDRSELWFRRGSIGAGGYFPWFQLYHQGTILGTVSQTGGVPTGALRQLIVNANGRAERDASGSMECWRETLSAASATTALGSRFRSVDVTWTFPSAFLAGTVPVITGTVVDADCDLRLVSVSNTQAVFRIVSDVSKPAAISFGASAKGIWSTLT